MRDHAATSTSEVDPFEVLAEAVSAGDTARVSDLLLRHRELASRLNDPMPGGAFGTPVIGSAAQHLKDRLEAKYPTAGLVVLRFPAGAWKDVAINSGKLELFLAPSDVKKS
jgi:hypothetical protein